MYTPTSHFQPQAPSQAPAYDDPSPKGKDSSSTLTPPPRILEALRTLPDPTTDTPAQKQYTNGYVAFRSLFNSIVAKASPDAVSFQAAISTETSVRWKAVKLAGNAEHWGKYADASKQNCKPNENSRANRKRRAQERSEAAFALHLAKPEVEPSSSATPDFSADSPSREPSSGKARRTHTHVYASPRLYAPIPLRPVRSALLDMTSPPPQSPISPSSAAATTWPAELDPAVAFVPRPTNSHSASSVSSHSASSSQQAPPTSITSADIPSSSSFFTGSAQASVGTPSFDYVLQQSAVGAYTALPTQQRFPSSSIRDDVSYLTVHHNTNAMQLSQQEAVLYAPLPEAETQSQNMDWTSYASTSQRGLAVPFPQMQITEQLGSLSLSPVAYLTSPTSPYFPSVPLPTEVNAWWAPFFDESQLPIDFASTSSAPAQSSQTNACQIDWSIQPF